MTISINRSTYNYATGTYDSKVDTFGVGTTLNIYDDHIQVMSDEWASTTYATYWDDEAQKVCSCPWVDKAEVDATPEVWAKVRQFAFNNALEYAVERAKIGVAEMKKGDKIKVVRGRDGKGIEGTIAIIIARPYRTGYRSNLEQKFGIATSDRKVKVAAANGKIYDNFADITWAWERNCQLVSIPEINMDECNEQANAQAERQIQTFRTTGKRNRKIAA